MENITIQKARDLETPAREWLQRVFSRSFGEDEEITILVFPPRLAPSSADRLSAAKRMDAALEKIDERTQDISDEEMDASIDEAMNHVRRWEA